MSLESLDPAVRAYITNVDNSMNADVSVRKASEDYMVNIEIQQGFAGVALRVMSLEALPQHTRQATAIHFKNFIGRRWKYDAPEENKLSEADRQLVKQNIVGLMLTQPNRISQQLAEAVKIVSASDFPDQWPTLIPELVSRLTADFSVTKRALETAASIFDRYRSEGSDTKMVNELKHVLAHFCEPLLGLYKSLVAAIPANQQNPAVLENIIACISLVARIFYLLNYVTIPEFFEDHMADFFEPFLALLKFNSPTFEPEDGNPTILEELKTSICQSVELYVNKYEDEFKGYVPKFVSTVWELITSLPENGAYDALCTAAISMLKAVVTKVWNKELFNNEAALKSVCERVVIPQIKLRENDLDMFSNNPNEYVRRDMEGSDVDTRRRICVDFVQGLMVHFDAQITTILKQYIMMLLSEYAANPGVNWAAKDAAMYLVIALTVKDKSERSGVTSTNPYVDIVDFFGRQVLPELAGDIKQNPILKADCLKFVSMFRNQLPPEAFGALMPHLLRHLGSESFVVHTYAAAAIFHLLSVKDPQGRARVTKEQIRPLLPELLKGLFEVLTTRRESGENEYVMRAIMRVCASGEEQLAPMAGVVIQYIVEIMKRVAANPQNPKFNHSMFETLACLIHFICPAAGLPAVQSFEGALFPIFQTMLGMESAQDFGPYVFQILTQLLEFNQEITAGYAGILPSLVHPALYNTPGNIPALARLLRSYLKRKNDLVLKQVPGILGVFQKLLSARKTEHYAVEIAAAIVQFLPAAAVGGNLVEVFRMLLNRLQRSQDRRFVADFIFVVCTAVSAYGFKGTIELFEKVQPGVFGAVFEKVWLPNVNAVGGPVRKIVAVGMTQMLCSPDFVTTSISFWPRVLEAVIVLFEAKEEEKTADDEDEIAISDAIFSSGFLKLKYTGLTEYEEVVKVPEPRLFLAQQLAGLTAQLPGKFAPLISSMSPQAQQALQSYIQKAQVSLA